MHNLGTELSCQRAILRESRFHRTNLARGKSQQNERHTFGCTVAHGNLLLHHTKTLAQQCFESPVRRIGIPNHRLQSLLYSLQHPSGRTEWINVGTEIQKFSGFPPKS
ncbi:hypothetical protein D3C74_400340 [compost metagenome]